VRVAADSSSQGRWTYVGFDVGGYELGLNFGNVIGLIYNPHFTPAS